MVGDGNVAITQVVNALSNYSSLNTLHSKTNSKQIATPNTTPTTNTNTKPVVADTGATGHFFEDDDEDDDKTTTSTFIHTNIPLTNIKPTSRGIEVLLPNKATMKSTHTALLDIPNLPESARTTHIFPQLASGSLLSIGQLCDAGCTALFDKHKLYIFHNGKIIMQGTRQRNKLWTMDAEQHHSLNSVIDAPTIAERIEFHSRSLFSPTLSTLAAAIKAGYLSTFPSITKKTT